jgi:hypothetical protein
MKAGRFYNVAIPPMTPERVDVDDDPKRIPARLVLTLQDLGVDHGSLRPITTSHSEVSLWQEPSEVIRNANPKLGEWATTKLAHGRHPQHFEKRRVRIHDLTPAVGYIDADRKLPDNSLRGAQERW